MEELVMKYVIIVLVLLLIPAINMSGITQSRMRKRMAEIGVRNMMKRKDIQKVVLHQEQNGKMFRQILNVHYALLEKISFLKQNK